MDELLTEARNPASTHLDELSALQFVRLMNAEDAKVISAVASQAGVIARAIDLIADRLRAGGRLVYAGAGTSGRLGILDATECPPTFNAPAGLVIGVIAGGPTAVTAAVEGAEDHPEFASKDLANISLSAADVLVGIASSGRTPYVLGAVEYARRVGARTIGLSCNADSQIVPRVDLAITPVVGPEVLSGSTRLKAGTATKLVLNMLSTGAMVRLGKTFGNLMVDLRATNEKLRHRTNRIVREATGLGRVEADALLERCRRELKTALVVQLAGVSAEEARDRLRQAGGWVRAAVGRNGHATLKHDSDDLVLGFDGGGTRTVALLAAPDPTGHWRLLGRGEAGPSNRQAIGTAAALAALDEAAERAFAAAAIVRRPVRAACLGLAGAGRQEDQDVIREWASKVALAETVDVIEDAALLPAAGTPDGWGVAVVAGTGSMAFACGPDGQTARAGGWGHLLGDEGSGYAIATAGLRAVARAADRRGPSTSLTDRLLAANGLKRPEEMVGVVYRDYDRTAVAALAPVVLETAANGDWVALEIVRAAAGELAAAVVAAARPLGLGPTFPVALAGGLLASSPAYRELFLAALVARGITATPVTVVVEPAEGAVRLALGLGQPAVAASA
ncbi:N-acetylmuramic acid 6-phosphate etherase [Fimbriiglobus ruber]|uniref:N-acetylmuramic acid 6-phosphate etherase n=1 Tax=Fimbriiglobus ruber TaxID=1908690 RepID=A0A225D5Y2_9BACT|nr:N-acetylmuramic acid 6-phosphate etherase [Fimbriiglobus ruber]OWK35044.1 N-acetylmuramic acid 6-phosphate etherase [Fimbriiglobus ruber]